MSNGTARYRKRHLGWASAVPPQQSGTPQKKDSWELGTSWEYKQHWHRYSYTSICIDTNWHLNWHLNWHKLTQIDTCTDRHTHTHTQLAQTDDVNRLPSFPTDARHPSLSVHKARFLIQNVSYELTALSLWLVFSGQWPLFWRWFPRSLQEQSLSWQNDEWSGVMRKKNACTSSIHT